MRHGFRRIFGLGYKVRIRVVAEFVTVSINFYRKHLNVTECSRGFEGSAEITDVRDDLSPWTTSFDPLYINFISNEDALKLKLLCISMQGENASKLQWEGEERDVSFFLYFLFV